MKQSDIVELLRKEFGRNEVIVFNANQKTKSGILDTLICFEGKPFFIEIKIDKDTLRKSQKKFISRNFKHCAVIHYDSSRIRFEMMFFNSSAENIFSLYFNKKEFFWIKRELLKT